MRYDFSKNPEILDCYERGDSFFGVVRVYVGEESAVFEFGVEQAGYRTLRKLLQTHAFDTSPGLEHRYFFLNSYKRSMDAPFSGIIFRTVQGKDQTNLEIEGPNTLVANLLWFGSLKSLDETSHLKRLDV